MPLALPVSSRFLGGFFPIRHDLVPHLQRGSAPLTRTRPVGGDASQVHSSRRSSNGVRLLSGQPFLLGLSEVIVRQQPSEQNFSIPSVWRTGSFFLAAYP